MLALPKIYSQLDKRWKDTLIGNSETDRIKDYGCLITCLSMVAYYFGFRYKPHEINKKLLEVKGFAGSRYKWGSLARICSNLKEYYRRTNYRLSDEDISRIKNAIDRGSPVMVWLDYNPRTIKSDMHWVVVTGYNPQDENDFTIADPLGGKIKSMKKYLGWFRQDARKTIEAYVIYDMEERNTICIKEREALREIKKIIEKVAV